MRVMVIVKASKGSEAGEMPDQKLLADQARGQVQSPSHAAGEVPHLAPGVLREADSGEARDNRSGVTQAIVEHHFHGELGGLLLGERFIRAGVD